MPRRTAPVSPFTVKVIVRNTTGDSFGLSRVIETAMTLEELRDAILTAVEVLNDQANLPA